MSNKSKFKGSPVSSANKNVSPEAMCSKIGPQTSTPLTLPEVKLEESGVDSSEEELDVDLLDDNTVAHLLPLARQIRDEYSKIDEKGTSFLKTVDVAYHQLSDVAKAAVDYLVEDYKTSPTGSTAAIAATHALKQMEAFSEDRRSRKMEEDYLKLSQLLVEERCSMELTKQKLDEVMEIVSREKLALNKLQSESKPPVAIQKKVKKAEKLEAKVEKLNLGEVNPQACMTELQKREDLQKELEALQVLLNEYFDLPADIKSAEKCVHEKKQELASFKLQLKALYKP